MTQKKIPMRQCLGCRQKFPKKELVRIVRSPEGDIALDFKGKANGRGGYFCGKADCLKKIRKSNALGRAFECEIPDAVYDSLEEQLREEANGH